MSQKRKSHSASTGKGNGRKKVQNISRISVKSLGPIRKKLLKMRENLMEVVHRKQQLDTGSPEVGDEADQATSSLEKEMQFELNDNERAMLDQIEGTLRKIEKGVYGLCESCQKPIFKARLDAVPFARYCIECQNTNETAAVS